MSINKNITYYFDILKDGIDHYNVKDTSAVTDVQAVIESMKNLILTEPGERIGDPRYGVSLRKFLFEPIDFGTATFMEMEIQHKLSLYETRISDVEIIVTPVEDDNYYLITINFAISLLSQPQKAQIKVYRVG
jgi:uncharacterized protein